jgi:hypothetical protein
MKRKLAILALMAAACMSSLAVAGRAAPRRVAASSRPAISNCRRNLKPVPTIFV